MYTDPSPSCLLHPCLLPLSLSCRPPCCLSLTLGSHGVSQVPGTSILVLCHVLRTEPACRRGLPCHSESRGGGWIHRPLHNCRPLLPWSPLQCKSQLHHRECSSPHWEGSTPILRRRRGLRRVPQRLCHLCPEPTVQSFPQFSPYNCLQDPS